ncbi:MAG: acyl carrier protein [Gemmatimonadota bacterium]
MGDAPRSDETLGAVAAMIRAVIGEDWALEQPITRETSFSRDLELESIEFVALAEQIQERYGAQVDFPGWLSQMDLDSIIGLTVGDVVEHIDRSG